MCLTVTTRAVRQVKRVALRLGEVKTPKANGPFRNKEIEAAPVRTFDVAPRTRVGLLPPCLLPPPSTRTPLPRPPRRPPFPE